MGFEKGLAMLEENVVRKDIRSIEGDDKLSPMSRKNVQMQFPNEICPTTSVSAWPWDVLLPDIMRFHLREGQKRLVRFYSPAQESSRSLHDFQGFPIWAERLRTLGKTEGSVSTWQLGTSARRERVEIKDVMKRSSKNLGALKRMAGWYGWILKLCQIIGTLQSVEL